MNLPGYIFGVGFYQYIFRDSLQSIDAGAAEHAEGKAGLVRHLTNLGAVDSGLRSQALPESAILGSGKSGVHQMETAA